MLEWEASIGFYFQEKGHQVEAVICDGISPACILREIGNGNPKEWYKTCDLCKKNIKDVFDSFGIKNSFYQQNLNLFEKYIIRMKLFFQKTKDFSRGIYKHAIASTIRYTKSVNIENESKILKEFCKAGYYNEFLANKIFSTRKPNIILMSHGIYSDWGPVKDEAFKKGIPVLSYAGGYLKNCFYFGILHRKRDTVWGLSKIKKSFNLLKNKKLIKKYLENRYKRNKGFDIKTKFNTNLQYKKAFKKQITVFLHLTWDASGETFNFDFDNLLQWSKFTHQCAVNNKNANWIFKVHPAEKWHGTNDPLLEVLAHLKSENHIKVIDPESLISPLSLIEESCCIVTAFGTVGLEAVLQGKPVICSQGAHYSNFGFTYDWETKAEYKKLLKNAHHLGPLNKNQIENATAYAYEIWCKKQRPLKFLDRKRSKNYGEIIRGKKLKYRIRKDKTLLYLNNQVSKTKINVSNAI